MSANLSRTGSVKVPRASLSVTMLKDPEYVAAVLSSEGRHAVLLFVCLLMAAKDQDNGGEFACTPEVLAMLIHWPLDAFEAALKTLLEMPGDWVVLDGNLLVIRGFAKWNAGWGGAREGAGRKTKRQP